MTVMIDTDMPDTCCACDFEWSNFVGDKVCMIVNTDRGGRDIYSDPAMERPDWCPLHEVKFTEDEKIVTPKSAKSENPGI